MKTIAFCVLLLLLASSAFGQENPMSGKDTTLKNLDPVKAEKAKKLVYDYTRIWLRGDTQSVDSLVALCAFPFAWDRKEIIPGAEEFRQTQLRIIKEKGRNRVSAIDSVYVKATRHEILDKVIPVDVYYVVLRLKITRSGKTKTENALFAVQVSGEPKIVGLSD